MRQLCSMTLISEAVVICFAALVAMRLTDFSAGSVWAVAGPGAVVCVLLCGALRHPWAITVGWVLQGCLVASGVLLPVMYVLGVVFAVIWFAAVAVGRKVEAAKAAHAEAAAGGEGAAPPAAGASDVTEGAAHTGGV